MLRYLYFLASAALLTAPANAAPKAESTADNPLRAAGITLGPWQQLGPFVPRDDAFEHDFGPERESPIGLTKRHGDQAWSKARYPRKGCPDGAILYLYRSVTCDKATEVTWRLGVDDGYVVWCNGKRIAANKTSFRNWREGDQIKLSLRKGENDLLVKVWNMRGNDGFMFATDATGGVAPQPGQGKPTGGGSKPKPGRSHAGAPQYSGPTIESVRLAVRDLMRRFPERYPKGGEYLRRLEALAKASKVSSAGGPSTELLALAREALLANPLLDVDRILVVRRRLGKSARSAMGKAIGHPSLNSHTLDSVKRTGWDNEISVLGDLRNQPTLQTLYKPEQPVILTDIDLHFDADRILFSSIGTHDQWHVLEVNTDGTGLRQLTPEDAPEVRHFDACYLPDGRVTFTSTAAFQGLPCEYGSKLMAQLYSLDPASGDIRQLTFEQDSDWCPTMMPDGRVMYLRWEYTDTAHYFTRVLMSMNPDGTDQRAVYGSNSYFPNGLFYAKPIGDTGSIVAIAGGHHGISRSGRMLIVDPNKGRFEADGVVQEIPFRDRKVEPIIRDRLVDGVFPQFCHPFPLGENTFLVSAKPTRNSLWGIYLVDVFDNVILLKEEEGAALLEPIPLRTSQTPPVPVDRTDPRRQDAVVFLTDVSFGPGLTDVPRGSVKALRVFSYDFAHLKQGGHNMVGIESSWDVKRIIGTVPVHPDGSALFRAPANLPLSVQPLDADGAALQLFRSWFVAKPGEVVSCVGCHEDLRHAPPSRQAVAALGAAIDIEPWHGPPRPFSFALEVQPVLDRHCVACHDGTHEGRPNFADREERHIAGKRSVKPISRAYVDLQFHVRRPGPENDYHMLNPMEYHASTSELVQMLRKGHHGVRLGREAWERLYTWIDLNAPYRGRWYPDAYEGKDQQQLRLKYAKLYANVDVNPMAEYDRAKADYDAKPLATPVRPQTGEPRHRSLSIPDWPIAPVDLKALQARVAVDGELNKTVSLGDGVEMAFVRVPAGTFVMGSADGYPDEGPLAKVAIDKPFWMGVFEVTNRQYHAYDSGHESKFIDMPGKDHNHRGYPASNPDQPVIRVSWREAMAFCEWLSAKTSKRVTLPTEAQWEWACRAGAGTALSFGALDTNFAEFANLADSNIRRFDRGVKNADKKTVFSDSYIPRINSVNDRQMVGAAVGSYQPNAWGLHDMHGNVCEWTRSAYRPYPYRADDGRNDPSGAEEKTVRGGSWRDRPKRATASFRLPYAATQKVFNVGFRVVVEGEL